MSRRALVVEDEAPSLDALAILLGRYGYEVDKAQNLAEAEAHLAATPAISDAAQMRAPHRPLDLAILDLGLPDGDGLSLIGRLVAHIDAPPIVVLTGETRLERAVLAMQLGATDFLSKPLDLVRLDLALTRLDRERREREEKAHLRRELLEAGRFHGLIGRSPPMREAFDRIERVAPTELSVFITGESGTGKELAARAIHEASRRRRGPFLALNCGAIPRQLAESELFGHEAGAFTGAQRQHIGAFERAAGGTLFLDELTEMPLDLQVVLLRVLENRTFTRVGGSRELPAEVRVIAGSNRDPRDAVREGQLRQDLYFRLHVMPLEMPPLRVRGHDVLLIAESLVAELGHASGQPARRTLTLSDEARRALLSHPWPGNVRELKNAVQRAAVLAVGDTIRPADLGLAAPPALATHAPGDGVFIPADTPLSEAERRLVEAALQRHKNHRGQTARALGISPKTLYNKLKAWGLDESTPPA